MKQCEYVINLVCPTPPTDVYARDVIKLTGTDMKKKRANQDIIDYDR